MSASPNWFDIEKVLVEKTLESQSDETLQSFLRVEPNPSNNPAYHHRFDNAQRMIRQILEDRRNSSRKSGNIDNDEKWYKKPIGIVFLSVSGGAILLIIKACAGI